MLYIFNPEKGEKDWEDNYLKPIKEIISVLASNEVPGPEKVGIVTRVGTGIAAEYFLTKKLKKAYKKLLTDPRLDSLKKGIVEKLENKLVEAERNTEKFTSIGKFLKDSKFGRSIRDKLIKTNYTYDEARIYKVQKKINSSLKKGDLLYLDKLHYDHLEVFDQRGKFKAVLNFDGTLNKIKTAKIKNRSLKL